jgi:hypothetical protein
VSRVRDDFAGRLAEKIEVRMHAAYRSYTVLRFCHEVLPALLDLPEVNSLLAAEVVELAAAEEPHSAIARVRDWVEARWLGPEIEGVYKVIRKYQ